MSPALSPLAEPGPGVTGLLEGFGYTQDLLRFDYPVWMGSTTVNRVPVVGFARRRPQDMTTATIVGARSLNGHVDDVFAAARILASPVVVLSRLDQVEIWTVPSGQGSEQQVTAAPENDVGRLVTMYRSVLGPASLLAAKNAQRQLALFPVDVRLLATARDDLFAQLKARVEDAALLATSPVPRQKALQEQRLIVGSQVVVGALAALMIRDKFELTATSWDLFDEAERRFPNYFASLAPTIRDPNVPISDILEVLGNGINYEALDPAVVSRVYEEAIVDRSERLKSGVFYTPPELAARVLQHVPVEEFPPEDRLVLDPACGSGTLLLAAHDRLQALAPSQWERDERHAYVSKHLRGMDRDQFAVDIARLALLLHALPEGNSWDVTRHDTLATAVDEELRPTIIVSNPPWRDIRSDWGRRRQLADNFLRWTVDALRPDGFFAVILPSAWLASSTSQAIRTYVQERTAVFEVWRLPDDTFASARTAPCVVFGQVGHRHRPWLFRRLLRRHSRETFYRSGVADEIYLGVEADGARPSTYLRGPLDEVAPLLKILPVLESRATVQNGPVPEPPVADRGRTGDFPWLKSGHYVPAFGLIDHDVLLRARFPQDFHRAGTHDGSIFRRPKLLISGDRSPANPWRLKVGLDTIGVIPRDSLHMVIPHDDAQGTLYALLAILGSAFAAAWVDSYETKLAIETGLIRELPVPAPGPVWATLEKAGRQMVRAAGSPPLLAVRARELDGIVFSAYNLPGHARRAIEAHLAGFLAPEGAIRYPETHVASTLENTGLHTFGALLAIESPDRLRLWVPGVTPDEGLVQPVPRQFLGWHCVEGATFDIDVEGSLSDAHYTFQRRSYQDFDDEQGSSREVPDRA